jgi:enoyl-CoA hydratase
MAYVDFERRDHIAVVSINRPERRNALGREVRQGLTEAFLEIGANPDIWVALLRGEGGQAFCAGADLKEIHEADARGEAYIPPMAGRERHIFEIVRETYKPVIACINGAAVAGGLELALACDVRVASDDAVLGMPEAKRGMGATFASVVLPRLIPLGLALEMLFTGDYLSAEQARQIGLVNHVVPKAEVEQFAARLAERMAQNAPLSLRRMKEMALKSLDVPVAAGLRLDVGPNPYLSRDRQEGVAAFVERRPPRWEGR